MNKLEQVQDFLARALTVVNRITLQNREMQLKIAQKLIADASAVKLRGTSTILKRVTNEINSAISAVNAVRPNVPIRLNFKELKDAQNDLALLAEQEANQKSSEGSTSKYDDPSDPRFYLTDFEEEIFKRHGRETPKVSIGNRPFATHRVPLVVISKPMINTATLVRLGVDAQTVNQYAVIHNQIVIGISHKASFKEKQGRSTKTSEEKAAEIADMISKNTRRPLEQVTSQGYPYQGATWFWYAEAYTLNALYKSANSRLAISKWGFAFN